MGQRGPKPTPTKILKLRGTYRKDRHAPNAPEPEPALPRCPDWFARDVPWGRFARQEYRRLGRRLYELGVLSELDRDVLLLRADAFGRWRYWRSQLARTGWTQRGKSGFEMPRPEVAFLDRAAEEMRRWGALLGLSPSDRRNVSKLEAERTDGAEVFLFGPRNPDSA